MSLGHCFRVICIFRVGFIAKGRNKGSYLCTKQNSLHVLEGQGDKFQDKDSYSLEIVSERSTYPQKLLPARRIISKNG